MFCMHVHKHIGQHKKFAMHSFPDVKIHGNRFGEFYRMLIEDEIYDFNLGIDAALNLNAMDHIIIK